MEDKDLTTHSANSEVAKKYSEETQGDAMAKAVKEHRNTMPYVTASSCVPIGAVVPTKLAYETIEALNKFVLQGIDTTEFVREKLGYDSRIAVCDAFASEQVDALALAIVQAEKQKGFILGDMAGIGKGRVVAGMLRYAKKSGKIPIFVTIKSTLFSDIYRDFNDIGGFGGKGLPTPLIMNGDTDASIKRKVKGEEELVTLFKPLDTKELRKITDKGVMPKGADLILMTYTQLGANLEKETPRTANALSKYKFLENISSNSFYILDESHCGAGDGNSAKNLARLLDNSSGVMFSSATYSKEPKSMELYISKTDIRDSNIRPTTIVQAVRENGEAIQEYIASMLVKSGQMIRRERTFDKCKIDYKYIQTDIQKYYELYDKVMRLYDDIENFSKSEKYKNAVKNGRKRLGEEQGVELVAENDPMPSKTTEEEAYKEWKKRNIKKYVLTYDPANRVKNRFQWIENLLFSIKADFVANEVVRYLTQLKDEYNKPIMTEYRIGDNTEMVNTNFKPIIGVRNTAETSLKDLGYKLGQKISKEDNDYAKTLINIARSLTQANLTLEPVKGGEPIIVEDARIINEDFSDKGVEYQAVMQKMINATSGLPLSPIDYMIDKIESTPRPNWDKKYSQSDFYRVEELTKRSLSIRKKGDSFEVVSPKTDSITDKVDRFNMGTSDVIIINTAGSTGISLHSNIEFVDKRPRVMLMHQVELDVATEVQKRGRINRTGQVNNPAYSYVVSCIPSEVRKLLMLRRKLRSLDANTTGNVKQSAKASEIRDKDGNEIEDMTNKYGYAVLQEFKELPNNEVFRDLVTKEWWGEKNGTPEDKFDAYLREVEKLSCELQERFYNQMNSMYSALKRSLEENDEWDLETNLEDLKASTINKKVLYDGNNQNQFTKSVFVEDKWVSPKGKPYTKDELFERMEFLAGTKDYAKYHEELTDEFEEYMQFKLKELRESYGSPDISQENLTEEEKEQIIEDHKEMVREAVDKLEKKLNEVKYPLRYFKPNKIVYVPTETDLLMSGAFEEDGTRKRANPRIGKFVGYKINKKSDNKWSPMNIELEFATTSRIKPILRITLTKQYRGIIDWIMDVKSTEISPLELAEVNAWIIKKKSERDKMRMITGELFRGFEVAGRLFGEDINYQKKKRLIKYSNSAGGVETGIRLWLQQWKPLTEGFSPTFTPINSDTYKDMVKKMNYAIYLWWSSNNEFILKEGGKYIIGFCTGIYKGRGGVDIKKPKKEYISEYAKDEVCNLLEKSIGVPYSKIRRDVEMISTGSAVDLTDAEFYSFSLKEDKLFELLDVMYRNYKILENVTDATKSFVASNLKDPLEGGLSQEEEKEGIYEYYLTSSFNEQEVPPNYIPNSYKKEPDTEYGVISLKFPISMIECGIYKVTPAKITEAQAVKNVLNAISDDKERLDFIEKVKTMKDDPIGVATLVQETVGVNPIYAVGYVSLKYAGKVIAENIDKPLPTDEIQDTTNVVEVELDKVELTSINWDSVQDFMIKFKSI